MALFNLGRLSFEHERALNGPTSVLQWICMSITSLQTYHTVCLSISKTFPNTDDVKVRTQQFLTNYTIKCKDLVISSSPETDMEDDGMAQILVHGRQTWWGYDKVYVRKALATYLLYIRVFLGSVRSYTKTNQWQSLF